MTKNKNKAPSSALSQMVLIASIFGFLAGLVGQIVADAYVNPWQDYYLNQSLQFNESGAVIVPELQRVRRVVGLEQDFAIAEAVSQINPTVVGIYEKKSSAASGLNSIYTDAELLGGGFILTNDGWIITDSRVGESADLDQLVVIFDNQQYAADQLVLDAMTGATFIKISAVNLPVVVLGDSAEAFAGQLVFAINRYGDVGLSSIINPVFQNRSGQDVFVQSTEAYEELILLGQGIGPSYNGSPLVNLAGEVIGVVQADGDTIKAIPVNQFRSVILSVLRDSLISRPYFGASYINLNQASGLDGQLRQGQSEGALIVSAPLRNSPASQVIEVNDIVVSVDNQPVSSRNDLTSLIQQYQAGDEISLTILRAGELITETTRLALLPD